MRIAPIANGERGSSVRAKLNKAIETVNITMSHVDRIGMAALDKTKAVAYLIEGSRNGIFVWDGSDLSHKVAVDPLQGVFVTPSSDHTGASGAWVRVLDGYVTPEMFGAYGDLIELGNSAHDDRAAIQAAIDFCGATSGMFTVEFPRHYRLASFNPAASNRCCLRVATQGISLVAFDQNAIARCIHFQIR